MIVLQSFPEPRLTTNPYIVMLRAAVEAVPDVELRTFSWRRALLGRYDVFHAHWPEILVFGHSRLKSLIRQGLFAGLLLRLIMRRVAVVRTVHNIELPDPMTVLQARLLRAFDRLTVLRIKINPTTELRSDQEAVTIPHGHYRDWFERYPRPESIPGRIGYFGLIRRYKRVESLLVAFAEACDNWSLRIAGSPSDHDLRARIGELASADERILAQLAYVDDAEIVQLVGEAQLIVLPYREMHNSGALLTTLSLDRPVLVPANEVNARIAEEVGPGWVLQYRGELTAEKLRESMREVREVPRSSRPDLSARDWAEAGQNHAAAYRRAIAMRRVRPSLGL